MSNPIIQQHDIKVDPSVLFSPFYEYGMPIHNARRVDRGDYFDFDPMKLSDATSIFHNFYGIECAVQIQHRGEPSRVSALAPSLDYQTMVEPIRRYQGVTVPFESNYTQGEFVTYLGIFGFLYPATRLLMAFNGTPPENSDSGFFGFGIKLAEIGISARSSRFGGQVYKNKSLKTYRDGIQNAPIGIINVGGEDLSVFDGTYQQFQNNRSWQHPDLKPDISAKYSFQTYRLRDNSGQVIPFIEETFEYEIVNKQPKYNDDGEIIGAISFHPPEVLFFEFQGDGKFYNHTRGDLSYLQPNVFPV